MTLGVPLDKRERAIKLLQTMIDKKKAKVCELQSLWGYLNFICKAIFLGRTFLRRMYAKYSGVIDFKAAWGEKSEILARINADQPSCTQGRKLKQHHHVHLDNKFKLDCNVWLEFLKDDMMSMGNRPMVDILDPLHTSHDITFYSDTSVTEDLGFGCILNNRWIWGKWQTGFIKNCTPSIEFLELFGLCAGMLTWGKEKPL